MNHSATNPAAAAETKPALKFGLCASYHGTRFDLTEGREWLVTSEAGHSYVVTVWVEGELGRLASCRCDAFKFGNLCKHIRYAQAVDSILTNAPVREIKPVYC